MDLKINVNKKNWKKLALAVGDKNPVHYLENNAICPGVFLFAEVENIARKDSRFNLPLLIRSKFMDYVIEGDSLILNKNYYNNKSIFDYYRNYEKVISVEFENVDNEPGHYFNYHFDGDFVNAKGIFESDLKSFNESLNNNGNQTVYSTFGVGRVLENFLVGRYGSLLKGLEFFCCRELELGDISVKLKVEEESRRRGRKEITDYIIRGEVSQFNRLVSIGYGKAQRKRILNDI